MSLIDRDCVRRLLESDEPDATLVFVHGDCVVLPADRIDDAHRGLVVVGRDELLALLSGGDITDRRLDDLAHRLDNVVRDLGA